MDVDEVIAAAAAHRADVVADPDVRAAVDEITESARSAHPEVAVGARAWGSSLGRALSTRDGQVGPAITLRQLPAADLWLATACGEADPAAIAAFERQMMPEVDRALRRFKLAPDRFDELRQRIRIRLLVARPEQVPRIGQYTGRGSLAGWVRTVAARSALNAIRDWSASTTPADGDAAISAALLLSTPELAAFRQEHRTVFVDAFRQAFSRLDPHARNLLRMRHVEELPLEPLARAYNVHVSTISKRLTAAREALAGHFGEIANAALGHEGAVRDLVGLVQSRFDASLRSLLSTSPPKV